MLAIKATVIIGSMHRIMIVNRKIGKNNPANSADLFADARATKSRMPGGRKERCADRERDQEQQKRGGGGRSFCNVSRLEKWGPGAGRQRGSSSKSSHVPATRNPTNTGQEPTRGMHLSSRACRLSSCSLPRRARRPRGGQCWSARIRD